MFRILEALSILFAVLGVSHSVSGEVLDDGRIFMDCSTESFLNVTDKQCSLFQSSSRHFSTKFGQMFGEVETRKAGGIYPRRPDSPMRVCAQPWLCAEISGCSTPP